MVALRSLFAKMRMLQYMSGQARHDNFFKLVSDIMYNVGLAAL